MNISTYQYIFPFMSKTNNLSNIGERKGSWTFVGYYFLGLIDKPVTKLWFCLGLSLLSVSHWFLLLAASQVLISKIHWILYFEQFRQNIFQIFHEQFKKCPKNSWASFSSEYLEIKRRFDAIYLALFNDKGTTLS